MGGEGQTRITRVNGALQVDESEPPFSDHLSGTFIIRIWGVALHKEYTGIRQNISALKSSNENLSHDDQPALLVIRSEEHSDRYRLATNPPVFTVDKPSIQAAVNKRKLSVL